MKAETLDIRNEKELNLATYWQAQKSLESKKKKPALTLFYDLSRAI